MFTEHTAKLRSPRAGRRAEVARGARLLPRPPVAYLLSPGSPRRGGATACAAPAASRRISRAAAPGATPMARAGSAAAVLFRRVPGASWVLAGTEITTQRAEAARRSRAETAGGTAGPPPPPGTEPNWRWEFTCPTAHPSGPGCGHLSSAAVLLRRRLRGRGGEGGGGGSRPPSSAPAAPPPSPLVPGEGLEAAATAGRGAVGHGLAGCGAPAGRPAADGKLRKGLR